MAYALTTIGATALLIAFVWAQISANQARRTLANLRRNCFVTDERGHRVRYTKASPEARAKAER